MTKQTLTPRFFSEKWHIPESAFDVLASHKVIDGSSIIVTGPQSEQNIAFEEDLSKLHTPFAYVELFSAMQGVNAHLTVVQLAKGESLLSNLQLLQAGDVYDYMMAVADYRGMLDETEPFKLYPFVEVHMDSGVVNGEDVTYVAEMNKVIGGEVFAFFQQECTDGTLNVLFDQGS